MVFLTYLGLPLKYDLTSFYLFYVTQMVFEAIKGTSFTGDIAIDDFKIRDGACPAPGDCDFEDADMCSWTNGRADDFDWIIGRGGTPSFFTGPSIDHTTGTGAGVYISLLLFTNSTIIFSKVKCLLSNSFYHCIVN